MSIRKVNKDHLGDHAATLVAVPGEILSPEVIRPPLNDALMFWTYHAKETEPADFRMFSVGEHVPIPNGAHVWNGPFNGRPELISQLIHAVKENLLRKAPGTVICVVLSLKSWWRLFDAIEDEAAKANRPIKPVRTVSDISDLHRERAFQSMTKRNFVIFVRLVNITRAALGLRQLYWCSPDAKDVVRRIPDTAHSDPLRHALKHGWFAALGRWEQAEKLLIASDYEFQKEQQTLIELQAEHGEEAKQKAEDRSRELSRLRMNYKRYRVVSGDVGTPTPTTSELRGGDSEWIFSSKGYNIPDLFRGFFPDSVDIRMAFFHCMASTGWNQEVLLDLDVDGDFLEVLPARPPAAGEQAEPERYLMTGWKDRAGAEVYTEGMTKSRGSAGMVVQALIRQTAPLRERLRLDLREMEKSFAEFSNSGVDQEAILTKHRELTQLRRAVRSPWLSYHINFGIVVLTSTNAAGGGAKGVFLRSVINDLNKKRVPDDQLPYIAPEQFRDIFAAYIYRVTGGSVLHVQHALGHASLQSTQKYLDNTVIKAQSERNWRALQQHLWQGMADGVVDPTILAKLCRDGEATIGERQRLVEYRKLRLSRIGVRCKDPFSPPKHIDPSFTPDGKSRCVNHVCTLCPDNAVLAPESWQGLSMRLAELLHIRAHMSVTFFSVSTFALELHNTEAALALFDTDSVQQRIVLWQQRIASGEHRAPDYPSVGAVA